MNPLKYIEHGSVHFVTTRTEEGLPFEDSKKYQPIFEAIVGRAQYLYPTVLIAAHLAANHFHMLLKANNPEHLPLFVGYIKQELTHAVNAVQGRKKRTLWCDGYDSPILLRYEEILYYLTYIYTQSQSAHLSDSIEEEVGVSTFQMFMTGRLNKEVPKICRPNPEEGVPGARHLFSLSPYAFREQFVPEKSEEEIRIEILGRIKERERELREERKEKGIRIVRRTDLSRTRHYVPEKQGRRSYVICWCIEMRRRFLVYIKSLIEECRRVYQQWKRGDYHEPWPLGFFPPCAPRRANLLPT